MPHERYLKYMSANNLDAIIASSYKLTARMLDRYFKDFMLLARDLREFNPLVGFTRTGDTIIVNEWLIEDALDRLAGILKEKGLGSACIGLEMLDLPAQFHLRLAGLLPKAGFVDASWVFYQALACKTPREIGFITTAVETSETAFRNVMTHIRECLGRPVSDLIWRYYAPTVNRFGAELLGSNLSGEAWQWRQDAEPVVAAGGEPINFDLLCAYQGMISDIAFRGMVGQPDAAFQDRFEKSIQVVQALVRSIKAGMTAAEAEAACLENIKASVGAWDGYWAVHGVGFGVHEFPLVGKPYQGKLKALKYADYVFEVSTVLSVEAIAEQMFVVGKDGLRRLGKMPMQIYCA